MSRLEHLVTHTLGVQLLALVQLLAAKVATADVGGFARSLLRVFLDQCFQLVVLLVLLFELVRLVRQQTAQAISMTLAIAIRKDLSVALVDADNGLATWLNRASLFVLDGVMDFDDPVTQDETQSTCGLNVRV